MPGIWNRTVLLAMTGELHTWITHCDCDSVLKTCARSKQPKSQDGWAGGDHVIPLQAVTKIFRGVTPERLPVQMVRRRLSGFQMYNICNTHTHVCVLHIYVYVCILHSERKISALIKVCYLEDTQNLMLNKEKQTIQLENEWWETFHLEASHRP
jgi:hypothetical protein